MNKELHEMTNEELWELFPIIIKKYNPVWKENYLKEKELLEKTLGTQNIYRINHYGSTAVPNLISKPTIDILLEIIDFVDTQKIIKNMQLIDYIFTPQPNNSPPHMMYMKGYNKEGFKGQVYHVHVRYAGDWGELYFRDYLIENKDIAKEYGDLKLELMKKYKNDRDGYTNAKTDFIKHHTEKARALFKNRYK